ncbi:hypothetical protein L1D14_03765 [Vibrio tubiashii]|uniref:hypothetical protein n=1 Tax=Vibrio tubiashii TaxID=29498 RepID=UPI001EFDDD95|nr:hypothetical protein [Vibrio tubiashii]MCG9575347.1 hypothetical protein [Vibrio tubiashii]
MKLKYLPLLVASFAVMAEGEPNLEAGSHVLNSYNLTITIKDEGQSQQSITQRVAPNDKAAFGSPEPHTYISAITTTHKWYHKLLGIEPEPIPQYETIKTGLYGSVKLETISENEIYMDFQSSHSQLVKIEKYADVELPKLNTRKLVTKSTVNLDKNEGCIQLDTDAKVCISKV